MKQTLLLLLILCGFHAQSQGNWQQLADYGNFGRHRAVSIAVGNRVFAGTGHINGTGIDDWFEDWWEYEVATDSWTQKASYPGGGGSGDQDLTAIAVDGIAYVGMGQLSNAEHYKYDPITNIWTQLANAPSGSFNNTFPFEINGKGYYMQLSSNFCYKYDPATDTWTQLGNLPFTVSYGFPSFAIGNKGYVKTGINFFEYDPATDIWTPKAAFPGYTPNRPVMFSQNGYGFSVGGYLNWGTFSNEVWKYDPTTDTWTQIDDFPGTTRRWAVCAKMGERIFFGLGTNGTNFNDWWEFNQIWGVEEFNKDNFKVYPNVATDHINFTSEDHPNFTLEVIDLMGKQVATDQAINGRIRLERNGLNAGAYIYRVLLEGEVVHSDRIIFE